MRTSSEFQTSSLVLLAATVVFGALATTFIYPLLSRSGITAYPSTSPAEIDSAPDYTEFYPIQPKQVRERLDVVTAMAGRPATLPTPMEPQPKTPGGLESQPANVASKIRVAAVSADKQLKPREAGQPENSDHHESTISGNLSVASDGSNTDAVKNPPAMQIPQGLPAGSVYAPVTVNVDGSLFAGQMQALEKRLETVLEERALTENSRTKKIARSQRKRSYGDDEIPSSVPDESLNQITNGLEQLATSLKDLESKTESSLAEISRQTEQYEASSRDQLQQWQQLLELRLKTAELAARTEVAAAPQTTTADIPVQVFAKPSSIESKVRPMPAEELAPSRTMSGEPQLQIEILEGSVPFPDEWSSDPEVATQEQEEAITPEPSATDERQISAGRSNHTERPSATSEAPVIATPEIDTLNETEELPPVELKDSEIREFIPHLEPLPEPNVQPEAIPDEHLPELEMPPEATLRAVPERQMQLPVPINSTPAVAFEHVYRFKMADVEDGGGVVPADGACPRCGKVHKGVCGQSAQRVTQTSSTSVPGRQNSQGSKSTDKKSSIRYIPRLNVPSLTTHEREPGILHRLGSSIRHMGKTTVE